MNNYQTTESKQQPPSSYRGLLIADVIIALLITMGLFWTLLVAGIFAGFVDGLGLAIAILVFSCVLYIVKVVYDFKLIGMD